jgi:hypothetical protein
MPCAYLAGLRIENTNLLSSTVVPAGSDLPEYCRVLGYARPAMAPVHSINYGLRRGYAASTMDSLHWGSSVADRRWAWNKAFYGRPPQRSYFSGCSNGGRMAAMEAQRHPKDFDGIISGCPSLGASSLHLFFTWLVRANAGPRATPMAPDRPSSG